MFYYQPNYVLVITRPKLVGVGEHWGVQLANGQVAHYTDHHNLMISSIEDFSQRRDVTIVREVSPVEAAQIPQRLQQIAINPPPYDATTWNCETFANWLTGEKPVSNQVTAWGGLGLAALFVIGACVLTA